MNAALRRLFPAGIRELSASGCLLQIPSPVPVGSIGLVEVELGGIRYAEWFRVARIESPLRDGEPHVVGVEFLQLALAGEQSLRGAMRSNLFGRSPRINSLAPGKLSGETGNSGCGHQLACAELGAPDRRFSARSSRSRSTRRRRESGNTVAQLTPARTDRERTKTIIGEEDMKKLIARFVREDQGQDLIEYVLIATFVSVGALAGATALGVSLNDWYDRAATWVDTNGVLP